MFAAVLFSSRVTTIRNKEGQIADLCCKHKCVYTFNVNAKQTQTLYLLLHCKLLHCQLCFTTRLLQVLTRSDILCRGFPALRP